MAKKKVRASAFVDATLKTTALLTFIDPETKEQVTDEFTVEYLALSPKKADALEEWMVKHDKRLEALEERRRAHEGEQATARQKADAEGQPFTEKPFEDPEEAELKHGLAQLVARMISSIPEIEEDDGSPFTVRRGEGGEPDEASVSTLAGWAAQNLRSIRDAVRRHAATDPTKPASSPST